jgi:membrane-associated phospholipid phosphatase
MNNITRYTTGIELDIPLILDYLGLYAPLIQFFSSLFFLRNKFVYLRVYLLGFVFNNVLNILLKMAIKEPRPTKDIRTLEIAITNNVERIGFHKFGMPSGHAQTAFFITVFLYLSLKHTNLLYLCIVFSLIICYQRVKFEFHSTIQVIVGSIIGSIVGYIFYQLAREKIKGRVREREDDYGPI